MCVPCPTGAATCTAYLATQCNLGYFLSSGVCTACSSTTLAESCLSAAATAHLGCPYNNYLSSAGTCTACGANTAMCVSNTVGIKCVATFYAIPPYTSIACGTAYTFTGFA